MKKRMWIILGMLIQMVMLTGCGVRTINLSEEQSALVAEYAVSLLLKYDANHQDKLLSEEELLAEQAERKLYQEEVERMKAAQEEATQKKEQAQKEKQGAVAESTAIAVSEFDIASLLGLEGMSVSYQGHEITESYPMASSGELGFSMDATSGNQLLILHFTIQNNSDAMAQCDMLSIDARYSGIINGEIRKNILTTMLMDDFASYQGDIQPLGSTETVLIMELTQEEADALSSVQLNIKYNGEVSEIILE